jgi:hypothetical protein
MLSYNQLDPQIVKELPTFQLTAVNSEPILVFIIKAPAFPHTSGTLDEASFGLIDELLRRNRISPNL